MRSQPAGGPGAARLDVPELLGRQRGASSSSVGIVGRTVPRLGGLSVRASRLVAFRLGYRFRLSRGAPIDADHLEAGLRFQF